MKLPATLILAIIAFLAVRYAMREGIRAVVKEATTDHAANCLVLRGHTTSFQDGHTYITGSFTNNCDRKFSNVTVAFMLDRSGVSTAIFSPAFGSSLTRNPPPKPALDLPPAPIFAYSRDVRPGETRQFKTQHSISEDATFRFDKNSG